MSGHSKWANIKHKKEANDKARGSLFTKLTRMITLAVLESGGNADPEYNFKLRLAIDKAKHLNMPKENIARAIAKGSGPDQGQLREIFYEAFLPGGVAVIIHATTDNVNRTTSAVRQVLEKGSGRLASQGAVAYLFKKCAMAVVDKKSTDQETILNFTQQIEAIDIEEDEENYIIYFPFERLGQAGNSKQPFLKTPPELYFKPISSVTVSDQVTVAKIFNLVDTLDNLDDVQGVYTNLA